jgi:hypothetical protein
LSEEEEEEEEEVEFYQKVQKLRRQTFSVFMG